METAARSLETEEDATDRTGAIVAVLAWLAMVALAIVHVWHYGTGMPALDDLHMVDYVGTNATWSWHDLWAQHNEHRIPLPKLLYILLVDAARDFRAGTWFDLAVLAAVSLALIGAARRMLGRTPASAALFPLVLLNWGHAENLLNSFQLCFVLPVALTAFLIVAVTWTSGALSPRRAAAIAVATLLLPACGTVGVVEAACFAAWSTFVGVRAIRSTERERRLAGRIALGGVLVLVLLCAWYFVDFDFVPGFERPKLRRVVATGLQFVAQSFGWTAYGLWPWSALLVLAPVAASVALLVFVALRRPAERERAVGLLAAIAAASAIAASVAWGRANDGHLAGFSGRYGLLSSLLWVCAYFTWLLYADAVRALAAPGRALRGGLALLAALIALSNLSDGARYGWARFRAARQLGWDVEAGMTLRAIAQRHWGAMFYGERAFFDALRRMHAADMGPFRRSEEEIAAAPRQVASYPTMRTQPIDARSDKPFLERNVDGEPVLIAAAGSELTFSVDTEATAIRGRYGVYTPVIDRGVKDGLTFEIEWIPDEAEPISAGDARRVLARWNLDPVHVEADRGARDFDVELPGGRLGEVALRVVEESGRADARDWGFWTNVELVSVPR